MEDEAVGVAIGKKVGKPGAIARVTRGPGSHMTLQTLNPTWGRSKFNTGDCCQSPPRREESDVTGRGFGTSSVTQAQVRGASFSPLCSAPQTRRHGCVGMFGYRGTQPKKFSLSPVRRLYPRGNGAAVSLCV